MRLIVGVSVLGAIVWGFALIGMATVAATFVASEDSAASRDHLLEQGDAASPVADIAGLAPYPGAVRTAYHRDALGDLTFTEVEYTTGDSPSAVRAFYDAVVSTGPWTTSDATFRRGDWMYSVQSGGLRGVVVIHPRGEVTLIEIEMSEPSASRGDSSQR